MLDRISRKLAAPVSGSSLAFFRIAFGTVMFCQALEFFPPKNEAGDNLISLFYSGPKVHWNFSYFGFSWIRPFPEPWMTLWFVAFAASALAVAIGLWYRSAIIGLFCTFTYIWMMDQAWYLNHFYLSSLLAFLLIFMPASTKWSVDSWRRRRRKLPRSDDGLVPFWCVFLLRFQVFVPYFFGGVAKISADWLAGEPVRMWVRGNTIGKYLTNFLSASQLQAAQEILRAEGIVWLLVYGGLIFDLAIGFLLVVRRTRFLGLVLVFAFHGVNFFLFNIGVFPVLASSATLIFLDPDWPDRLLSWLRRPRVRAPDWEWFWGGLILFPPFGAALGWKPVASATVPSTSDGPENSRVRGWVSTFVSLWVVVQLLVPLRHYAIPGDVLWTDEGSNFAWLMMLRNKEGSVRFRVRDPRWDESANLAAELGEYLTHGGNPPVTYRFVDAFSLDWSTLPEFLVVSEPLAGERIVFNRASNGLLTYEQSVARIREHWATVYGRRPAVIQPRSLMDVLEDLVRKLAAATPATGRDLHPALRNAALSLSIAKTIVDNKHEGSDGVQYALSLQLYLAHLRDADSSERYIRDGFATVSPFGIQGAPADIAPVLLIDDGILLRRVARVGTAVDWEAWRGPREAFLDVECLEPLFMRSLPLLVAGYADDGTPVIVWNHTQDLTEFQHRAMSCFPFLQYKYSQRIARWWEDHFQRRPGVYVSSLQRLNHHPMQPAIDPNVDLADTAYRLLGHNPWYLPLRRTEDADAGTARK